jgi:hypothetical protein
MMSFLGRVDLADDLHRRRQPDADRVGQLGGVDHHAVGAEAQGVVLALGLEVDVGHAAAEADEQDQAEQVGDVSLGAALGRAGGVDDLAAGLSSAMSVSPNGLLNAASAMRRRLCS